MKVILNQTVPKVGKAGTVVNVADGFARNYLFPRGLAIVADKRQIEALEKRNARIAAKTAGEKATAEALAGRLNGKVLKLPVEVGGQGKLFGAITSGDLVELIKAQLGETIDRKQIALIEAIKRLGRYDIELDLHRDVDARLTLFVYDKTGPDPTLAEAAPTEEAGDEADELEDEA